MAEALLRQRLREFGVEGVEVSSAGFLADDQPVAGGTLSALKKRSVSAEGLTPSRRVTPELLGHSDLILAMARLHVREAVVLNRYVFGRTFTLKELVRRAEEQGARESDESFDAWLARVGADRTSSDHLGESDDDDVEDPVGGPARVFRRTADELDVLIDRLVGLAWPLNAIPRELAR
jgi:protein-tyrosine-phosphatase